MHQQSRSIYHTVCTYVHKIIHVRVLLVLMYPINVSVLWRWFLYELASIITTRKRISMHAGI